MKVSYISPHQRKIVALSYLGMLLFLWLVPRCYSWFSLSKKSDSLSQICLIESWWAFFPLHSSLPFTYFIPGIDKISDRIWSQRWGFLCKCYSVPHALKRCYYFPSFFFFFWISLRFLLAGTNFLTFKNLYHATWHKLAINRWVGGLLKTEKADSMV